VPFFACMYFGRLTFHRHNVADVREGWDVLANRQDDWSSVGATQSELIRLWPTLSVEVRRLQHIMEELATCMEDRPEG
jgi:hypothetical protein